MRSGRVATVVRLVSSSSLGATVLRSGFGGPLKGPNRKSFAEYCVARGRTELLLDFVGALPNLTRTEAANAASCWQVYNRTFGTVVSLQRSLMKASIEETSPALLQAALAVDPQHPVIGGQADGLIGFYPMSIHAAFFMTLLDGLGRSDVAKTQGATECLKLARSAGSPFLLADGGPAALMATFLNVAAQWCGQLPNPAGERALGQILSSYLDDGALRPDHATFRPPACDLAARRPPADHRADQRVDLDRCNAASPRCGCDCCRERTEDAGHSQPQGGS